MELQNEVQNYLDEHGIKKKYLASILGIHPTQLWKWLSGRYILNESQTEKVINFLNGKC